MALADRRSWQASRDLARLLHFLAGPTFILRRLRSVGLTWFNILFSLARSGTTGILLQANKSCARPCLQTSARRHHRSPLSKVSLRSISQRAIAVLCNAFLSWLRHNCIELQRCDNEVTMEQGRFRNQQWHRAKNLQREVFALRMYSHLAEIIPLFQL